MSYEYKIVGTSYALCPPLFIDRKIERDIIILYVAIESNPAKKGSWKAYKGIISSEMQEDPYTIQKVAANGAKLDEEAAFRLFPKFDKALYNY